MKDDPGLETLKRTECACPECVLNCKAIPGMLAPSDLAAMVPPGADPFEWAEEHLRASPGATAYSERRGVFRIPTLVPATRPDGVCHWLTAGDRCAVHAHSPAGCRFFGHEAFEEADAKSRMILVEIMKEFDKPSSLYVDVLCHLDLMGLVGADPEKKRERLAQLLREAGFPVTVL